MKNALLTIIIGVGLIGFQAHGKTNKSKGHKSPGYAQASQYFKASSHVGKKKSRDVASAKKNKVKNKKHKSVAKKAKKNKKRHASNPN